MIFFNLKSEVLPKIIQALLSFILAIFPLSILFETGEAALDRLQGFPDVSGRLSVSAQTLGRL